ncbi:uncharacterized protein BT62DRAFT_971420 [Guyanagaster necrorhizus]|uniref:NOT2/NOT3/NOT5 C-terminal domain-containing protein n=1 Tax=Guyanagaster necrorhizus TaxID=856835 RepID=A0A9P7VP49_9AGAR|nr:uncharacterized protein BT62DRAFT_971420 [Guyanagaster necrorhizus MCA 3950]KAG7444130.1 hypothetical protein BT62DRAFT_971420 [Guyanagaster necrorhizus MCA 3950]
MNRQGQPNQRPPNLTPNASLAGQFRPPYPFGMPPRSVIQTGGYVPGLQQTSHRTAVQSPSIVAPSPYVSQRGQSSYAFGGGLQHHPTSIQPPQQSQQQQQSSSNGAPLPPSSIGAPSVSSTSEVGLDPNDFPALGSTSGNNGLSSNNNGAVGSGVATSYASQAGTGVGLSAAGVGTGSLGTATGVNSASQPRDFTPDDFPALGGQTQNQGQNPTSQSQNQSQENHSHPPGLNGFQHSDHAHQQHRQNLLGALSAQTPGMINLAPTQTRNVHPGFQTDTEKQQRNNFALKLNQASLPAWNSPNINPGPSAQTQLGTGSFANPPPTGSSQQNGAHQNSSTNALNGPPGVPPPTTNSFAQQQQQPSTAPPPYTSNGMAVESHPNTNTNSNPISSSHGLQHPQTPAQQVLVSAADRWGLLGLLLSIKNAGQDPDQGLSVVGTDLGTMGLDMGYTGNLYSTFITPWADQSAARSVEPDFHLPACYNVQPPPPGPAKVTAFSDETLFFMFYSSPKDALQEIAAQELWNRNWRFHKDLRLWITKETGMVPSQKVPGGESGQYHVWDAENWVKDRKDMTVMYNELEEKNVPAFLSGPGIHLANPPPTPQVGQQPVQTTRGASLQASMAL